MLSGLGELRVSCSASGAPITLRRHFLAGDYWGTSRRAEPAPRARSSFTAARSTPGRDSWRSMPSALGAPPSGHPCDRLTRFLAAICLGSGTKPNRSQAALQALSRRASERLQRLAVLGLPSCTGHEQAGRPSPEPTAIAPPARSRLRLRLGRPQDNLGNPFPAACDPIPRGRTRPVISSHSRTRTIVAAALVAVLAAPPATAGSHKHRSNDRPTAAEAMKNYGVIWDGKLSRSG